MATDGTNKKKTPKIDGGSYFMSIPNDVLYDDLYPQAYRIAALISNMTHKTGYYWLENDWVAEKFGISERSVSRAVSQLVERGHYSRFIDKNDRNKRYLSPLPEEKLIRLVLGDKKAGCVDKSVYTKTEETGEKGGAETPVCVDKSVHTYRQICPEGIDKSGVSYKEGMYKEDVEGEPPPDVSPLSNLKEGSHEYEAMAIFLNVKEKLLLALPGEFFEFFEAEVLGRFDKFQVNSPTVRDWHDLIWKKYGAEVAKAAIQKCRAESGLRTWRPDQKKVARHAETEYQRIRNAESVKQAIDRSKKLSNPDPTEPKRSMYADMSVEELVAEYTRGNEFIKGRIRKHRPEIVQIIQREGVAC